MRFVFALILLAAPAGAAGRAVRAPLAVPSISPAASAGMPLAAPSLGAVLPEFSAAATPGLILPLPSVSPQTALGTPGVYTKAFHAERTNPVIKANIEADRFVRLEIQRGKLEVAQKGQALPPKTLERVLKKAASLGKALERFEGASLTLIEGDAAHPRALAVSETEYQLAHAGTFRDARGRPRGKFAYMTAELFADEGVANEALTGVLEEEFEHAVEKFEGRAKPEAYGARQKNALEKLYDRVRLDFRNGRPVDPEPARPWWRKALAWFSRPPTHVPWAYKPVDRVYLYHGTTFADFMRTVDSGGRMKPRVSQFSQRHRDSIGYGNRRSGEMSSPMMLLQFPETDLRPLTSGKDFEAAVGAALATGTFPEHAAYVAADKPVPLSLMTPASKESILSWMADQRLRHPEDPSWSAAIAKARAALYPSVDR